MQIGQETMYSLCSIKSMGASSAVVNFKKVVSMVVIFSLALCSCCGNKHREHGPLRKVIVSHQQIGIGRAIQAEMKGWEHIVDEGTDIGLNLRKVYKNCSFDENKFVEVCTDTGIKSEVEIEKVMIAGWPYHEKEDIRCIFEGREGCPIIPAECMPRKKNGIVCRVNVVSVFIKERH